MKIFTSILLFAQKENSFYILLDSDRNLPTWLLDDSKEESFKIVSNGICHITGIDKVWLPRIEQAGVIEFFCTPYKEIYILYNAYSESIFNIKSLNYKWVNVVDCKEYDKLYNMIRFCLIKRT